MKFQNRIGEYLTITSFIWSLYLAWLIPFQLFVVQLDWEQFTNWLILGTIAEMFIAYPITKIITRYVPRITEYWDK